MEWILAMPRGVRLRDAILGVAVGAFVLGSVSLLGFQLNTASSPSSGVFSVLRVGARAPDFALSTSTGETVRLAELHGQPVWLTFWATWCPPCRTEMPDLQDLYRTSAPDRYRYVAVNLGEEARTVQKFLKEIGYTLPTALDETGEVSLRYQVRGLPTHIFIDADGTVQDIYVGVLTSADMQERVRNLW